MRHYNYFVTQPTAQESARRGILVLYKKNLSLKVISITQRNNDLVKIKMEHNIMNLTIYGVYADSDRDNPNFFLNIRNDALEDENDQILITGDFNTTLYPSKD